MKTDILRTDEDRKANQFETVRDQLRNKVHDEIKKKARVDDGEDAEIDSVAHELKHHAIREVAATESEIAHARKGARISQFIDYMFGIVYGLLGLLIALELMGARQSNGFKQFIDAITYPLVGPFRGLMPDPRVGNFQLMVSYIVGLIVYGLLHLAVKGLLRVIVQRKTEI